MMEHLAAIIIMALTVVGVFQFMADGMVLPPLRRMVERLAAIIIMALTAVGVFQSMVDGMVLAPLSRMMEHLTAIIIMALTAVGVFQSMADGMVLAPLRRVLERLPLWAHKPLLACPYCMVSVWGTAAVLLTCGFPHWWAWPVYALAAVGLQDLFNR